MEYDPHTFFMSMLKRTSEGQWARQNIMENTVDKMGYERPQITEVELDLECSILQASGDDFDIDDNNEL